MATAGSSLRILRVADVPRSDTAGVSGVMLRGGESLVAQGHEVEYLFSEDLLARPLPSSLRRLVMPLVTCVRVTRRARRSQVDVVEIHRPVAWLYALLARSRALGGRLPPCVLQCHGLEELWWDAMRSGWARAGTPPSRRNRAAYQVFLAQGRLASRYAAVVIVLTQVDARYLVDEAGLTPERVSVVNNGVERAFLSVERPSAPEHLRVLFFGSWLDRKGAADTAAAWAIVQERRPATALTVAGCGRAVGEVLRDFAPSCRDSVTVVPQVPRDEVPELLAGHDVLVLPSWYEGMPLAVLEAAAAGMAVVTTRIAGTLEVFSDADPEQDGAILVDVQDPSQLAAAVCRLAADRPLLESLQERARMRASRFTWDASACALAEAYGKATRSRVAV